MVKTFGEMDSGTIDVPNRGEMQSQVLQRAQMQSNVLKRRQMQSDELIKQFNSPTKPSLAGARKRNKTGPNQLSYRESSASTKHVLSKDIGGTTELKSLLTPINLFEDECIFCHSFRTVEEIHGPMERYLKGRLVSTEEGNLPKAIYIHKKCLMWTPKVRFDFERNIVEGLESEIRRASGLRCGRCGLRGAALGCYYDGCRKSFHVPCAFQITDCRWDFDERNFLCPKHVSKTLLCDKLSTHTKENGNSSSLRQSECSQEDYSFTDFEEEGQQSDQLKTTCSFLPVGQCTDKEGQIDDHRGEKQQTDELNNTSNASLFPQSTYMDKEADNHQRENQQTDQFNIFNPSCLPQSQCSKKEGISTNSSRDGQQIDQLETSDSSSLQVGQHSGEEGISKNHKRDDQRTHKHNTWNLPSLPKSCHQDEGISNVYKREGIKAYRADTSSCPSDQLVLLGLSLSTSEKDSLQEFACWTNAKLMKEWDKNVTHVIVGRGAGSSWNRSFEVLMAILLGKWVVHFEWIMDCSSDMRPRPEASYEVAALSMDSLGRIRATKGALNLFSGLRFRLSAYMSPAGRRRVRDLIAAAGGQVLESAYMSPAGRRRVRDLIAATGGQVLEGGSSPDAPLRCSDGLKPYFVFDGDAPGEFATGTLMKEVEEARKHAAAGARVISHRRVLDAVAAYDAETLNR